MTTAVVSKLEELIQPNKRGKVTNAQMIPALVTAIEAGSKEQLDILKEGYPEVFEASSTKYLNKKHSTAFLKIMNGLPLDEETPSETTETTTEDPSSVETPVNEENVQPEVQPEAEVTAETTNEEQVAAEPQEHQTAEQPATESEAV